MTLNIEITNESQEQLPEFIMPKIQEVIETALREEGFDGDGEVSILFTDDEGIKSLNSEFRHKDVVTDVLSFPQYDHLLSLETLPPYLYYGDVVISIAQAGRQAEEFGHSLEREIFYLVVHSILHLLGYDHMEEEDKMAMRQSEKQILKVLKLFKDQENQ